VAWSAILPEDPGERAMRSVEFPKIPEIRQILNVFFSVGCLLYEKQLTFVIRPNNAKNHE
jgi:hypothetical protein